jgi:hypothetical protein
MIHNPYPPLIAHIIIHELLLLRQIVLLQAQQPQLKIHSRMPLRLFKPLPLF